MAFTCPISCVFTKYKTIVQFHASLLNTILLPFFGPDAAPRLAAFARGAEAGVASIPDTKKRTSIVDVDVE